MQQTITPFDTTKVVLPKIEICDRRFEDHKTFVSKLDESWGVDALVGLDFFRKHLVTIDYKAGHLIHRTVGPIGSG